MNDEELRDYLKRFCFGREHLICSRDLVRQKNLRESDLRKKVNRLRRKAVPIASSREGYFTPAMRQSYIQRFGSSRKCVPVWMQQFAAWSRQWRNSRKPRTGVAGIARPFIPWIGSKEKLIPYIWQVFPPSPKLYLEPFGGGGALLLGMQPKVSRMDIYNDFNCDLVNLFLCARECTIQLVQELKFLPLHSRAEFDLLREFMKHKELLQKRIADEQNAVRECFSGEEQAELLEILRERSGLFDVQRAAAYYKVCRGSFSGTTTSFGVKPNNLTNFLYLFDDASKRLQDVVIENKDCLEIIRERDGPDSLIYCDPPYFEAEKLYEVGFLREKHIKLKRILAECAGYIVVSYNDCPFIRCLYEDFYILAFRRNNPLSQKKNATYGELIITNYDPRPYLQPQVSMFPAEIENGDLVLVQKPACGSLRKINLERKKNDEANHNTPLF